MKLLLHPYYHFGHWVFDDPRVKLVKEPFVMGISEMIDQITFNVPNAVKGFDLTFSPEKFPEYQFYVLRTRYECGGNWYFSPQLEMRGWLCPALYKYFEKAPNYLYVRADPLNSVAIS